VLTGVPLPKLIGCLRVSLSRSRILAGAWSRRAAPARRPAAV